MALNEEIARVISKNCLAGLKGVECPNVAKAKRNEPPSTLSLLFSGTGYDTWGHGVKPQVLKSNQVIKLDSEQVNTMSITMNDPRQFYAQIYPIDGKSTFYNGLYSHNGGADEMFTKFFEGKLNVLDAQQQYTTHEASVTNVMDVTDDFQRIINILPDQMDQDMYQKVIEFFGDSVSLSSKFGGVVDSTVSVRSCFSDGNMEAYLKNELFGIITGRTEGVPDGYIRYHRVSQLDIVGGNPENSNIAQRIETFRLNPVPIKFETIPIWNDFPEGPKRNNMKNIYDTYVQSKSNIVAGMINRLQDLRNQEANNPQPFAGYARRKSGELYGIGSGTVAIGQTIDFAAMNYKFFIPVGRNFKEKVGTTTVRIIKHDANAFHMEAIQSCDVSAQYGQFGVRTPTLVSGAVASNSAYIHVDPQSPGNIYESIRYDDLTGLYVCSGCNSYISGNDLRCDCPFVQ